MQYCGGCEGVGQAHSVVSVAMIGPTVSVAMIEPTCTAQAINLAMTAPDMALIRFPLAPALASVAFLRLPVEIRSALASSPSGAAARQATCLNTR